MRTHDLEVYLAENRYEHPKEVFRVLADRAEVCLQTNNISRGAVLDVGCAAGEFCYYLRQRFPSVDLTGIDVVPELIDKATRMVPDANLILGDVHNGSLVASVSQDIIFMCGVLSIFDSFEPIIKNLINWCRPGGRIYIFGLFNPYPADVWVQYRIPRKHSGSHRETGWNVFSEISIRDFLGNLNRGHRCSFIPFHLPFALAQNPADPARTWTLDLPGSERVFVNGLAQLCPLQICEILVA